MRTSLVFKFFIIITFCYGFASWKNVSAGLFYTSGNLILTDTIQPQPLQNVVITDTIIQPDTTDAVVGNDTLVATSVQPVRQRGTAVILDSKVDYSAVDSTRFDIRRQVVHLWGDADLKYTNIHLKAAYVKINFNTKEVYAVGMPDSLGVIQGNPVFQEGDQSFESREIRYNFETQKGRTLQVITEEADGYLHGEVVKMMESKQIHVSSGKYTTCDNPEPHFHISFSRAKIIPNDKIISTAPRLTIAGVRTPLILPFGFFPNTKGQASGILIPSYGETNNRGFYLENGGFYWGINDYIDLSIRGDIYSRGSWGARMGSNYRKRYKYNGNFNINYAINILGERDLPGYERNRDFRVIWNHSQDPKAHPNSVFRANVNAGSSQYNRFNPTTTNDYLSNTFSSNISYSANWAARYNLSVNARHSQNTITETVDMSLPEVAFSVGRFYPFRRQNVQGRLRWYEEITMNYNMNARNEIKTNEEDMFTSAMFDDLRSGVQHTIPMSHSFRVFNHFNLSNSINYNERWYFRKIEQRWDFDRDDIYFNPADGRVVNDTVTGFFGVRDFSYSSSLNTRIYGMAQFRRGPVTAVRHVVSPSLGFSLRPDFADPFWGYYGRYYDFNRNEEVTYSYFGREMYGTPQAGRSGSINFSVTNNLEMKVRSRRDTVSGERKIALIDNLSVSSSYNLAADSLNLSDIRVSGRTRLFGQFDVTYSSTWSPYAADSLGRAYNTFLWDTEKRLLRMRNSSWALSFNYNLNSGKGGATRGPTQQAQQRGHGADPINGMGMADDMNGNGPEVIDQPTAAPGVIDYSVPWSLRFSYSLNYNTTMNYNIIQNPQPTPDRRILQNLNFSGDVNLTPNWRIGFSSGYNFELKEITYTSLDIYRDLHCWELLINWIPFGFRQSYNLTLRVKSSVLQDLKLTRRTHHLDRVQF
ncbi:MAG: LPS-assembly protein LptD [Bacteroidetes bacterium]|nr:MAG: LPS-assembly protein LptD [Bacteroidota bacterium]